MHILYLITRAEMGGSQTHVLDLLQGFRDRFHLSLATGEEGFLTEEARRRNIPVYVLPNLVQPLKPKQDFRALFDVTSLLRKLKPDLIHCHTSQAGIIGRTAARLAGVPAIFTAHTWSFAEGTSKLWKLVGTPSERLAARWTDTVIAVSNSNRELAIRRNVVKSNRIVTVHNGVADTRWRAQPGRAGTPRITMVARFAPQKNQAQLLHALAAVTVCLSLCFIGDGPTRPEAEALANSLGIADRVTFAGVRTDTDRILADSDIFVLSTNWEGFPITILEAMRAGLPVIASDVDGVREAVIDESTGVLVPRGDLETLTAKLTLLLSDPALRERLGQAGRDRYEAEFTQKIMLDRIASVYSGAVLNTRGSKAAYQSV